MATSPNIPVPGGWLWFIASAPQGGRCLIDTSLQQLANAGFTARSRYLARPSARLLWRIAPTRCICASVRQTLCRLSCESIVQPHRHKKTEHWTLVASPRPRPGENGPAFSRRGPAPPPKQYSPQRRPKPLIIRFTLSRPIQRPYKPETLAIHH